MSDRLKLPPQRDFNFYQRRKHDKWRQVPTPQPALEAPVADSHAHVHMLPDPAWELARCAANGVDYVCMIVDPSEDGVRPFEELAGWEAAARDALEHAVEMREEPALLEVPEVPEASGVPEVPEVRIATGVHPHNAKRYDDQVEHELIARLSDPRVGAVGEIGLDYYYDFSPRAVQRQVFRRQIALAKQIGLPIALHLRDGDDPVADDAHREAFEILNDEGFPPAGMLLHCCALPADQLQPWIDAGCYIAYGGAITFKSFDDARAAACLVPVDRLLFETDAPFMTPEPMRGAACTPAHVVFTAERLAQVRGVAPGDERRRFLSRVNANIRAFYGSAR